MNIRTISEPKIDKNFAHKWYGVSNNAIISEVLIIQELPPVASILEKEIAGT